MKPIYMSASYDQVDIIKTLLRDKGIDTTLVAQEDAKNALAPKGIIWFELWLKREADADTAVTIIEQHEFGILKSSMQVAWEAMHKPAANTQVNEGNAEKAKITFRSNLTKEKREEIMRTAMESWLPINNQKVFQRLASMLGFNDEEIAKNEFNKTLRPWNPDRLKSQVEALQKICKPKGPRQVLGNT